jgi:Zn-dependent peptidase ImmA (M78 family)
MLDRMMLSNRATDIRRRLGEDSDSPIDVFALVHSIDGLTLVLYPLGGSISGVCLKADASVVIAVNSGMSYGRQRFTLAHELYHYYFDEGATSTICPVGFGNKTDEEKEADMFASYLLMPQAALYRKIQEAKHSAKERLTAADVVMLEQHFGVSRQAMLVRLQKDNEMCAADAQEMQQHVMLSAARLGYDISLYKPTPDDKNRRTYGHYIRQAENLLQADVVSTGKYEQWLLEAFRDDVVFGDDSDGGEVVD